MEPKGQGCGALYRGEVTLRFLNNNGSQCLSLGSGFFERLPQQEWPLPARKGRAQHCREHCWQATCTPAYLLSDWRPMSKWGKHPSCWQRWQSGPSLPPRMRQLWWRAPCRWGTCSLHCFSSRWWSPRRPCGGRPALPGKRRCLAEGFAQPIKYWFLAFDVERKEGIESKLLI